MELYQKLLLCIWINSLFIFKKKHVSFLVGDMKSYSELWEVLNICYIILIMQTDIYWALTMCQELYTHYCVVMERILELMQSTWFYFSALSISMCQWENHTSFPRLCLLIYKVGKMTPRESDKKQDVKTFLNPWYSIIFEDLPSWYLHIPFDIHIICNDFFYFMTYKHCICMCLHKWKHISGCENIYTHKNAYTYTHILPARRVSPLRLTSMQTPLFIYIHSYTFYYP